MTIYEVKQKVVDALGDVDVSKLSIMDVHAYAESLHKLHKIQEPDTTYADAMKSIIDQSSTRWEPPKPTTLNDLK